MKNYLVLAAVLAAFAFAQVPAFAADAAKTAPKVAMHHYKDAECQKQAEAAKAGGTSPSKAEVKKAYKACVKAKKAAAPAKTEKKADNKAGK